MKVTIVSVVPSPYQRDLFQALNRQPGIELKVFYLEAAAPDSPWPEATLQSWETVLPGSTLGTGRVRCHFNWQMPALDTADIVVINLPYPTDAPIITTVPPFIQLPDGSVVPIYGIEMFGNVRGT